MSGNSDDHGTRLVVPFGFVEDAGDIYPYVSDTPELQDQDSTPLTPDEEELLRDCEAKIEKGMATFSEVGKALYTIKSLKLYRHTYHSFDKYCRDNFGFTQVHAKRHIAASQVMENLKSEPIGSLSLPQNESQARQLVGLDKEEQIAVARDVKMRKGDERVIAEDYTKSLEKVAIAKTKPWREKKVNSATQSSPGTVTLPSTTVLDEPNKVAHLVNQAIIMIESDKESLDIKKVLKEALKLARSWKVDSSNEQECE